MSKVLQVDASSADAWVEKNLGSNQSDVWVTYDVRFGTAALAAWQTVAQYSGNFLELLADDNSDQLETTTINPDGWFDYYANTIASPAPVADAWVTVELHRSTLGVAAVYFDSVLGATSSDSDANDARFVKFGQSSSLGLPDAICYMRDFKVGTTRGGTNLFSDDLSSGALGNWTTLEGEVGVIDDPFPPPTPASLSILCAPGLLPVTFTERAVIG